MTNSIFSIDNNSNNNIKTNATKLEEKLQKIRHRIQFEFDLFIFFFGLFEIIFFLYSFLVTIK